MFLKVISLFKLIAMLSLYDSAYLNCFLELSWDLTFYLLLSYTSTYLKDPTLWALWEDHNRVPTTGFPNCKYSVNSQGIVAG